MDPEHPRKRLDLSRVKGKDKEKEPPIDTPSQENAPDPEPPSKELNMPYNKSKGKEKAPPIGTLAQEMADPSAGLKNSNRAKSKEKGKTPGL
jgi:hypothetical protein